MRKTVMFDRAVRLLVPVWHQPEQSSDSNKYRFKYKRPMSVLELQPNREYRCEDLQSLLDRGAVFASDADHDYVCSHGFIPVASDLPMVSPLTTGLDPEEELN